MAETFAWQLSMFNYLSTKSKVVNLSGRRGGKRKAKVKVKEDPPNPMDIAAIEMISACSCTQNISP